MVLSALLATMIMSEQTQMPTPSPRQLAWHKMEYYAFTHFGPNTFTDKEWGGGDEDPNLFNPTALDCRQWARSFKQAGMSGIIITAKHHDGFCLWPSKFSTHTVAQSKWKDGKGDVLKELSAACRAEGLKMGVYLSPWDRNHPAYGTPEYNQVFANMLHEVLTNYGPIFEVWFDGANGEGPNGKKQVYDWDLFIKTVRECQPNAVIFSDAGPDIRWVGNEDGHSAPTCWCTIDRKRYIPGSQLYKELTEGDPNGPDWVPAECDVSIRPGWFYHPDQDAKVKTPEQLFSLYLQSVGQNANLLLNVPPDRRGLIADPDVESLMKFKALRDKAFGAPLYKGKPKTLGNQFLIEFDQPMFPGCIALEEDIAQGQRVKAFKVEGKVPGGWCPLTAGTTIGHRRILNFDAVLISAVRVTIEDSKAPAKLKSLALYP